MFDDLIRDLVGDGEMLWVRLATDSFTGSTFHRMAVKESPQNSLFVLINKIFEPVVSDFSPFIQIAKSILILYFLRIYV
jgi:hypothetical protein